MRIAAIVLLSLSVGSNLFAQPGQLVKEPTFPSPNAASLGKYGDIPVSYHTGVPEISIPLHTIEEGSLTLPVSLSYHSSGIRVDELASFVGLGWSLNAGGMITRTVHGGPDEGIVYGTLGGANSPYQRWGWYKDYGVNPQVTACGATPLLITSPPGVTPWNNGCAVLMFEAGRGYVDCEPDMYTYNFGAYSGKFFFDANRKVHMIPESDLVIEPINSPSYFYAWKAIAPDGSKYYFGGTATEMSFSDPSEVASGNKHVSSTTTWYVYKIESLNGEDWINFDYVDDTYSFGNRSGHAVTFREFTFTQPAGEMIGGPPALTAPIPLSTTIVDGKRLSKITTSSTYTTIDFITRGDVRQDLSSYYKVGQTPFYDVAGANTISKALQHIKITTPFQCKNFELDTDYFSSAPCTACGYATDFDKKRLRLNWVQESDCAGTLKPRYEFFYAPQLLPRRYSLGRDMWGFYNGFDANTGLIESFPNPVPGINITYNTTNFRTVVESKAQAGILIKIKYPTSGTSEFTYESHRQDDIQPILGGLRIKSIVNKNDFGNTTTKNIKYPSGTLYQNPTNYKNHYPNNNDVWTNSFLGGFDFGIAHGSDPTPPMWSSQGYHIGYTKVKVEEPGNGYSIFTYLNTSPPFVNPAQYPFTPSVAGIGTSEQTNQSNHKEGALETVYVSNSAKIPTAIAGTSATISAKRVQSVNCLNCTGPIQEYGIFMDYTITTYRFNVTQEVVTQDGVSTTTNYTYGTAHNAPTSIQYTDSEGLARTKQFIYPGDAGSGAPLSMYTPGATFRNMLTTPIEEKTLVNGVLKSKTSNVFSETAGKLYLTSIKKYPTATTEFVEDLYAYDGNSNLISISKSTGANKIFLWGYNNAYPIAAVDSPVKYANGSTNFFYTSFEQDLTNVIADAKVGRKSWKGLATYTKALTALDPGNYVLSYFLKSGSVWNYQESTVTVTGTPGTGTYTISIPGTPQIDELRFYPKGALMQTYAYDPGIGITAMTNTNNVVSYYIYDTFSRLKLVKNDLGEIVKVNAYNYKFK